MLKENSKNKTPKFPGKSDLGKKNQNYYLFIFTLTVFLKKCFDSHSNEGQLFAGLQSEKCS